MKFLFDHSLVSAAEIEPYIATLDTYQKHLIRVMNEGGYTSPESSINLPADDTLLDTVQAMIDRFSADQLRLVVVIGIGGSNLGTKAIYDAMRGYYDTLGNDHLPKMIFLDTQDEGVLHHTIALMKKSQDAGEFCINVISKSGGTTETMTNFEIVYHELASLFPTLSERIVVTTDEGSPLYDRAVARGVKTLSIPKLVGGRFSVFSAVGLFPLGLAGFSLNRLRHGAGNMRDMCGKNTYREGNPAMESAVRLFLSAQKGFVMNDNFIFIPALESLGKWYRQLMGESVGKDGKGITPTVSIGSNDLHSVVQLYLSGPKNKLTTFIWAGESERVSVPKNAYFGLVPAISEKSVHDIMSAIIEGTKIAYRNQQLPYMEAYFENISEETMGEFLQMKMFEMMYLGHLMGVNTFDQPGVELYKIETKRILQGE